MSSDRLLHSSSSNSEYDIDPYSSDSNISTSFISYNEELICRLCHKKNNEDELNALTMIMSCICNKLNCWLRHEQNDSILIVPCACNELNEMVHITCLANYRKNSYNSHAISHCTLCTYRYNYNTNHEFNFSNANKLYYAVLLFELIKFLMLVMLIGAVAIFLNIIIDYYFSNFVNYFNITINSLNIMIIRSVVLITTILIISNILSVIYLTKLIIQYQFNKHYVYYRVNTENYFTIVRNKLNNKIYYFLLWLILLITFPVSIILVAIVMLFCRTKTHTFNNCYYDMYIIKNKLLT